MKKIQEQLTDYRKQSADELSLKLRESKLNYQDLAGQIAMGKSKVTTKLRETRKAIARMATALREKEILSEVSNG